MFCLSYSVQAQTSPVTWDFKIDKKSELTYVITSTATISDDWAIYSQFTEEGGPVPTRFSYEGVQLTGKTKELSKVIQKHSKLFGVKVAKFKKKAVFVQEVKVKAGATHVKGYVAFMCCNDKQCLPPTDVDFDLKL